MRKYLTLLKYEFKTITKDSTSLFMLIYPFLMLFLIGYVIPSFLDRASNNNANIIVLQMMLGVSLSLGSYMAGALIAFSIIENKDDQTILNLSVTPLSIKGYMIFKLVYGFIFSIISNLIILGGLKLIASDKFVIIVGENVIRLLDNLSWFKLVIFILIMGLTIPVVALLFASFAKNKIEGFTFLKAGAILIILPVLTIFEFFQGAKQYLLGIFPNFWPIKAMLNISMQSTDSTNLNYFMYMLIGGVFLSFLSLLMFKFFFKKAINI